MLSLWWVRQMREMWVLTPFPKFVLSWKTLHFKDHSAHCYCVRNLCHVQARELRKKKNARLGLGTRCAFFACNLTLLSCQWPHFTSFSGFLRFNNYNNNKTNKTTNKQNRGNLSVRSYKYLGFSQCSRACERRFPRLSVNGIGQYVFVFKDFSTSKKISAAKVHLIDLCWIKYVYLI